MVPILTNSLPTRHEDLWPTVKVFLEERYTTKQKLKVYELYTIQPL